MFFLRKWNGVSVSAKFLLVFSVLLVLILVIAITSYTLLGIIRNEVEQKLLVSTSIQSQVLNMNHSMEKARRLQRDFFLAYPSDGFESANNTYGIAVTQEISNALELNAALQSQISQPEIYIDKEQVNQDLLLYRAVVERNNVIFSQTISDVGELTAKDTGLQFQMQQVLMQIDTIIHQSSNMEVLKAYDEMVGAGQEYLLTQNRPRMQVSLNSATNLETLIEKDSTLTESQRSKCTQLIMEYEQLAQKIITLDVNIRGAFRDFDLQANIVDPISQKMIDYTDESVDAVRKEINNINQIALFVLIGSTVGAVIMAILMQQLLHHTITRNIVALTNTTRAWKSGRRDETIQIANRDELGELAQSFNSMAGEINAHVHGLEQRIQERTGELQVALRDLQEQTAIQAQLLQENQNQKDTIQQLSVPILPVMATAFVMPLVGMIDSNRIEFIQLRALKTIEQRNFRSMILDVTGVPIIDTEVARGLINLFQAASLLGTQTILVGIRPDVAQSIVALGIELRAIKTAASLQDAVAIVANAEINGT